MTHAKVAAAQMWCRLCCLVVALFCAGVSVAQEAVPVKPGLMWNRTGLPAVFPLQVRTLAGKDYYLTVSDAETGAPALAAYIKGGQFFRVLVPPGRYTLAFAYGDGWRGETALFGPGRKTGRFEFDRPLTFAVKGFGTKGGHVIDLRSLAPGDKAAITVRPFAVCQAYAWVRKPEGHLQSHREKRQDGLVRSRAWPQDGRPRVTVNDTEQANETVTDILAQGLQAGRSQPASGINATSARVGHGVRVFPRFEVRPRAC